MTGKPAKRWEQRKLCRVDIASTEQAVQTKLKQDVFFFHFSSFLTVYLLFECRLVVW